MPDQEFDIGAAMEEIVSSGEVSLSSGDEDDSFAADKTPASSETEAEPSAPAPAPAAAPAPSPAPAPAAEADDYPKTWKKEYREQWKTLAPEVKAEVLRREEDYHKGLDPYRNLAQRFQQATEPHRDFFQQTQVDPFQLLNNFLSAHRQLLKGGPEAAALLRDMAKDYKIDLDAGEPVYVDPQIKALQEELGGVKSVLSQREQAERQAHLNQLRGKLDAFAADPKNAHFNAVSGQMAVLLRADPQMTLEQAYDTAVWMNPTTREAMVQTKAKAEAEALAAAERKRAEEAEKASSAALRSSGRSAPQSGKLGSMDDTMRETLAAIRSRS